MSWTAQKILIICFNPHSTLWLGVLGLKISNQKSRKLNELPIKWFHFKPLTPTHPGRGSFRGHKKGGRYEEGMSKGAGKEEGGMREEGRREGRRDGGTK